jgi:hypothetical protein
VYARCLTQAVVLANASARRALRYSLSTGANAPLFCVAAKNHRFHRCLCAVDFFSLKLNCLARGTRTRPKSHDNAARSTPIKHVEKNFARALARGFSVAIPIRIERIAQK